MADADSGSKWLLGQSPQAWVHWIFQDPTLTVEAELSTEFQYVKRLSDSLLRVVGQGDPFLVLTEVQLRRDARMPRRIRAYAALAEEKYDLLVYPIVFYLLRPRDEGAVPDHYHSQLLGLIAHQDYVVIKAWELSAEEIVREENLALLPFVPLMRGADEGLIRRSVARLREAPDGEQLEALLGLFASFVLDVETIQQIVRWDMNVLRESPWYQEILDEGTLRGRREDIVYMLQIRFSLSSEREAEIADQLTEITSSEQLQQLLAAAVQVENLAGFNERLAEMVPPQGRA